MKENPDVEILGEITFSCKTAKTRPERESEKRNNSQVNTQHTIIKKTKIQVP